MAGSRLEPDTCRTISPRRRDDPRTWTRRAERVGTESHVDRARKATRLVRRIGSTRGHDDPRAGADRLELCEVLELATAGDIRRHGRREYAKPVLRGRLEWERPICGARIRPEIDDPTDIAAGFGVLDSLVCAVNLVREVDGLPGKRQERRQVVRIEDSSSRVARALRDCGAGDDDGERRQRTSDHHPRKGCRVSTDASRKQDRARSFAHETTVAAKRDSRPRRRELATRL